MRHLAVRILFVALGMIAGSSMLITGEVLARDWDPKLNDTAWACSTLYSHYPIRVLNSEDSSTALCMGEGKKGRKAMSRSEAYELCRDQFNATTLMVGWTSKGWRCRYYGR